MCSSLLFRGTCENGLAWGFHCHEMDQLRSGIDDYLKRHPLVDRFEAADQADDSGVFCCAEMYPMI
jgi:hypothetical protein